MLVLHHHQRAGPQIAAAFASTISRAIIRQNAAQGISRFFITDDNFARNKDWEAILDRLIQMREGEGMKLSLIIQVDTHVPPAAELHFQVQARRREEGLSSGWRTSIRPI